ncbi:hypothetical protein U27_05013 [Candidatus Vecturithrix granuli]|uniref:DUF3788 domain-containing protein n=1 Tax=Vecturithrix granuli TaxID=1499967 RepID=A0A081C0D5_VECG1|nr:hypothetical protein U27_05013 [Candidatus Vecturithrix granuli]
MVDRGKEPDPQSVTAWIGPENYQRWVSTLEFIETNYPGVFQPEWLFGGKKHGWSLRFKKSKSFCTLIPELNQFLLLIVFGAVERQKAELILPKLNSHVREDYLSATTYHDGKWLAVAVDSEEVLTDVKRLLVIKRKPKPS